MENLAILIAIFCAPFLITGGQALIESIANMFHSAKIQLHKKGIL